VNHYFPTSHLAYNVVLAALGRFNPARAVAPSGLGTGAIAIGYAKGRAGKATVQYELSNSSLGGTATHDGAAMLLPMNHFAPGTPVEIVETEYPVRVLRYDIWTDSAGAGRQRGGIGLVREYELQEDCILTVRRSNHQQRTWGLAGGKSPALARTTFQPPGGAVEALDVMETRQVARGTILTLMQTGGGGYGEPRERPAERVAADVADGYVSREAAREAYGVAIRADGTVDAAETARLRRG
jgi:N-methylhydantoinase B